MTTPATGRKRTYACNGVSTVFAAPLFRKPGELKAYLLDTAGGPNDLGTLLVEGVDYSVSGDGPAGTGQVTTTTAYPVGKYIRLFRLTSRAQDIDYVPGDAFPAASHENALDRLSMVDEEVDDDIGELLGNQLSRCVRVPEGESVDEAPPAAGRKGTVMGWNLASGLFETVSYLTLAGLLMGALPAIIPGPAGDLTTHIDTFLDLSGDDTDAINTAIAVAQAGTGILSLGKRSLHTRGNHQLDGVVVLGASKTLTNVFQLPGQSSATPIWDIVGSGSGVAGLTNVGNIATDPDEFMNGVNAIADATTGDIDNVFIDVGGRDIRGDVVQVAAYAGYNCSVTLGKIVGDNILRNLVSCVGGNILHFQSITGTRVGYATLDVEPDSFTAPVELVKGDYLKGRHMLAAGTTAAASTHVVHIAHVDVDPAHQAQSAPAYGPGAGLLPIGVQQRNCRRLRFDFWKANGFNSQAWKQVYNGGELDDQTFSYGHANLTDCCKTDVVNLSYLNGAPGVSRPEFGLTTGSITRATVALFVSLWNGDLGRESVVLSADARVANDCPGSSLGPVRHSGGNGILAVNSPGIRVVGNPSQTVALEKITSLCLAGGFSHFTATSTGTAFEGGGANNKHVLFNCNINGTAFSAKFSDGTNFP